MDNVTSAPARAFLGKTVRIVIDRPVGFVHCGTAYPINYGYIPNTTGGDGEEIDVYLLGVSCPVKSFVCRVIGIVYREDDCEEKLIAAPEGMAFSREEMEQAVYFQERFFKSRVETAEQQQFGAAGC